MAMVPLNNGGRRGAPHPLVFGMGLTQDSRTGPPSEDSQIALVQIQESLIFAPSRKFYKLLRIYKISYFWCSNKLGKRNHQVSVKFSKKQDAN